MNSTAKGEIAYARYVYAHTHKDDTTIRAPVANFWATRSHTLRAEAEDEFRSMCLEFPQFGYDVLSGLKTSLKCSSKSLTTFQPVSWTRSSSAKSRRRCILPQAALASVLVEESEFLPNFLRGLHALCPMVEVCWSMRLDGVSSLRVLCSGRYFLAYVLPSLPACIHTNIYNKVGSSPLVACMDG